MYLADSVSPDEVDRWVQSAAILHSNGDGLDIAVKDDRIVGVRGRAVDRVHHGRLGPKDLYGWQANNSPDRLTRPLVREGGTLVASRHNSDSGSISTARVPSAKARLSAMRTKPSGLRSRRRCAMGGRST